MLARRHFLLGGALVGYSSWYAYQRGLRYPRLSLEPADVPDTHSSPDGELTLSQLIVVPSDSGIELRAIAPEPALAIAAKRGKIALRVSNLAENAQLTVTGKGIKLISEEVEGITRSIEIDNATDQNLGLKWTLPDSDGLDFAVIGDTGGGDELDWALQRAQQLDAQFLLHLGDFNYTPGEYTQAIKHFSAAPIPCYISIGNHDFNDSGLVYPQFLEKLGPLNNTFTIAGARFVNLDTAADFFPAQAGLRGRLFEQLIAAPASGESVYFTHSPLKDPRPNDDHEVGGVNEVAWLVNAIKSAGNGPLLTGHVHHSAELEFDGIQQFTVGEGLGHEDLVRQKQVAKIMLAKIQKGQPMHYTWQELNMPWSSHTSATHAFKLQRDGRRKQLDWYSTIL